MSDKRLWESYVTSLNPSFLIYKIKIRVPTVEGFIRIEWENAYKMFCIVLAHIEHSKQINSYFYVTGKDLYQETMTLRMGCKRVSTLGKG